jgi:hypothetical protein
MSDMDAACVAIAFGLPVKAKKKKIIPSKPALFFFSELSVVFISFLKFGRRELHFLVKSSLFTSGYWYLYFSSKIAHASFFFLSDDYYIPSIYHATRQAVICRPGQLREYILSRQF